MATGAQRSRRRNPAARRDSPIRFLATSRRSAPGRSRPAPRSAWRTPRQTALRWDAATPHGPPPSPRGTRPYPGAPRNAPGRCRSRRHLSPSPHVAMARVPPGESKRNRPDSERHDPKPIRSRRPSNTPARARHGKAASHAARVATASNVGCRPSPTGALSSRNSGGGAPLRLASGPRPLALPPPRAEAPPHRHRLASPMW
mmetsp:Transcript_91343/g.263634  ORF Transcript_91343/g.263634 Transcript_91343/m.263634 type:complete len:201 (-) Transcript_91343:1154-1756(-)